MPLVQGVAQLSRIPGPMALFDRLRKRRVLHAVLPIALSSAKEQQDIERACVLLQTLRAGFDHDQCLHVHIVGRAHELAALRAGLSPFATPWLRLEFHDELELVPELRNSDAIGWVKQQVVKLAAARWLDADFWLTFDADIVCVRNFGIDDLFVDGRALLNWIPAVWSKFFPLWLRGSARLLGYGDESNDKIVDMTPVLYSRDVMRRVYAAIEKVGGQPWCQRLLACAPGEWAEMALYGLVAQRENLLQRYHAVRGVDTDKALLAAGSNWHAEGWQTWAPPDMSDPNKPGYFIVCGSHTGVPAELVQDRMAPVVARMAKSSSAAWWRLRPRRSGGMLDRGLRQDRDQPSNVAAAAPVTALDQMKLRVKVISSRPLIVRGALDEWDLCFIAPQVLQRFAGLRSFFLISLPWTQHDMATAKPVAEMLAERQRQFPQHSFFILCNTQQEVENFRQLGVPCGLFSHSIFVDHGTFRPLPEEPKRFDAVYNAALVEWKRHILARDVPSLALLFAPWHNNAGTTAYAQSLRRDLTNAYFVNQPDEAAEYRFLTPDEVARHINQARVGLCLSAVEGAMFSSMEYLLCGLPVVSTPSLGGRDLFFDADNSVIVEADAAAVAHGVAGLIARNPSPQAVRQAVVAKVVGYRQRFLRLVEEIYRRQSATWPPRLPLADPFIGSTLTTMTLHEYEKRIFQPQS